jgi:voltage-gated potassium channel Kch
MRLAFVALALGALVLGYIGLHEYLSSRPRYGTGVLDLVYWDLQLFVLDSAPLQDGGELPLTLQFARFAAPAATLSALFATVSAIMRGRIALVRARYLLRNHTIVCGTDPAQTFLTQRLAADGRRVVIVAPDGQADATASGLPRDVLWISGDPRLAAVLQAAGINRAREVMALTSDSAFNGEVAVTVRTMADLVGPKLTCFAEVADAELCAELAARALGAGRSPKVEVVFFSRHDRAARRLLDRYPISAAGETGGDGQIAVLVVGDGALRDALTREMRRRWSGPTGLAAPGSAGSQSLVVRAASEIVGVDSAASLFGAEGQAAQAPSHVFVCLDDDAAAIRTGLKIVRLLEPDTGIVVVATPVSTVFGRELAALAQPQAAAVKTTNSIGRRPEPGRLVLHNVTETVYSPEAVRRGDVEDMARAAHEAYVAGCRDRGDTPETNSSMVPWDALPEFKKEDNRDQAADIGRKLVAIGATVVPASGSEASFAFDDDEVERLARMEHSRWLRRRREAGWSYAPEKDEDALKHPDMVDWDALTAESQAKDRVAVLEIPGQLRTAGFAIVRGVT